MDMMEDLRKRIRPSREAAGLTQIEAGRLIGSKMQYWSDIERGRRTATLEQLIRIVNVLGLEVSLVVKQKPSRRKSA